MAILAELFLVLAGFDSGVSEEADVHPAEKEVFARATAFRELVIATSRTSSARLDHPVCRVIKREITLRYLESLAELESIVISQLGDLERSCGPLRDSLFYSTKILSLTADTWNAKFTFAEQLLSIIDEPRNVQTEWISGYILNNAGVPDMQELCNAIITEMDREWVNQVRIIVAEGTRCPLELLSHPQSPDACLINGLTQAMEELNKAADANPTLLDEVIELIDRNEMIIMSRIELPLKKAQCTSVFYEISGNVHRLVGEYFLKSKEVISMLELLRSVVFLGSQSFVSSYCDAHGDLDTCLRNFLEMDSDLSPDASRLGPTMLAPSHSTSSNELQLSIYGPLEFMFTAEQCVIYESMFDWLSKLALANGSIGIGAGFATHAYKILFDMIWNYYQQRIDDAFDRLRAAMNSSAGLDVRAEQDSILRHLVTELFLDSKSYRNVLKIAVSSCLDANLDPLRDLVTELETLSEVHGMDLRPFNKYR